MAALAVDRLHARYHGVAGEAVDHLDAALARVADGALDRALADVSLLDGVFAVCVAELDVSVDLDLGQPVGALADGWAAALAASLAARLAPVGTGATGDGATGDRSDGSVVVWRHEADALVDLVRSVARGDQARLWAWRQAGLVSPSVTRAGPAEVAAALATRPSLAAGVLRSVVGAAPVVPLSPAGWVEVAAAVAVLLGPASAPPAQGPDVAVARAVAATVPAEVWRRADRRQAEALAALALAVAAPARSRDALAVGTVAAAGVALAGGTRAGGDAAPDEAAPPAAAVRAPGPPAAGAPAAAPLDAARAAAGADQQPDDPRADAADATFGLTGAGPEPPVSWWGGVLFLVHLVDDVPLDPEVLARAAAAVSGAPPTDPAVLALAGWPADEPPAALADPPSPPTAEAVARLGAELVVRLVDRLGDDGLGDDGTDWVWPRRAVIEVTPGWVDVHLALDDVDVRLRRVGLDLDPGYVWWLGSVMRFVYG